MGDLRFRVRNNLAAEGVLATLDFLGENVNSLEEAAKSGVLHGADAAQAQALYDKAGDALDLADKADAAADADGVAEEVAAAQALIADLGKLTH